MKNFTISSPWFYMTLATMVLYSCGAYKQNVLFKVDQGDFADLPVMVASAQDGYTIQPFDQLQIMVYTNKGEQLIDPHNALETNANISKEDPTYQIDAQGSVYLPIVGKLKLGGLSIAQANELLADRYSIYYKDPYVTINFMNKRVIVLGATAAKIVPLTSEGINLLEVLALAGGLDENAKGSNIRLIRGDLSNPQVQVIDLSTIRGMKAANLNIQPNDIVYVEPVKKPFTALRDFTPILGAVTSILALIIALNR